ncbi:U-box domain-containing protein kinase family protein [Rhynchospora pubera]|uniref:RING-type E3 ubiquitin transferase n=2 Tax=Rhynchospora pubera TaxID=906938 RepID=A0AAV8EHV9_9POAL|nr:U-box domain-containing protein kinase family protein [Rhynchospora pubera]
MDGPGQAEAKVYVALPEKSKEGKYILSWVLNNFPNDSIKIIITHVHIPAQLIPMMGTKFPASQLSPHQVNLYRKEEWEKAEKHLNDYISQCSKARFKAEKLMFVSDDVAHGLVELISLHGMINFVMGAASDRRYSKGMTEVKSNTAKFVMEKADPSCQISFICKGHLVCTREAILPPRNLSQSASMPTETNRQNVFPRNSSFDVSNLRGGMSPGFLPRSPIRPSRLHSDNYSIDFSEGTMRSDTASSIASEDVYSHSDLLSMNRDDDLEVRSLESLGSTREQGTLADVCVKLQAALADAAKYRVQLNEEICKREKAEMDLASVIQKEDETKSALIKEKQEMEFLHKHEIEMIQRQLDLLQEEHKKVQEERDNAVKEEILHKQEIKIVQNRLYLLQEEYNKLQERDNAVKEEVLHKQEINIVQSRLDLLLVEYTKLKEERDKAVEEAEELRGSAGHGSHATFSEISLLELEQATENFSKKHKIGEGGFGSVYKGFLRNTMVAIKMLHPQSLQGKPEFEQEVAVLSTMRHPNLVTLIGICSEKSALIYEYLPNGSLEDRLACQGGTPPLTWQVRTRIIGEICRALLFLHSNPNPIVHGDLKPANILLDGNLVCKLSDFGISRLLMETNSNTLVYRTEYPRGTFAYMDPEFLTSGELTVKSDVYSFGIIILRLLTGNPPINIAADVEDAIETHSLHLIIDESAGEWPFVQAEKLANLGLRCAQMRRRKRPDLESEWKLVEGLMQASSLSVSPSFKSQLDEKSTPSYFMCPISQEVMKNPHVAADGYTYEAEAIKGWLDGGHKTSPMTNLPLPHQELTPNYALRSAIQEWLVKHS